MTTPHRTLDVRPMLRAGEEPMTAILTAVAQLEGNQGLRLLATFEPVPLFSMLAKKGFSHVATEMADGDWEILFTRSGAAADPIPPITVPASAASALHHPSSIEWPAASCHQDLRDLDPPEPMARILTSLEAMSAGEVLSASLCREPVFLLPELTRRGHSWQGRQRPDGETYDLQVRVGGAEGTSP